MASFEEQFFSLAGFLAILADKLYNKIMSICAVENGRGHCEKNSSSKEAT